jgi:hypothetical protein
VGARLAALVHVAEVRGDRVLSDERSSIRGDEHRDGVAAGSLEEEDAIVALNRDLASHVVDAKLGQALPYAPRGRAPLGLPELV